METNSNHTNVGTLPDEKQVKEFLMEHHDITEGWLVDLILDQTTDTRRKAVRDIQLAAIKKRKKHAKEVIVPLLRKRFAAGYFLAAKAFDFSNPMAQLMVADFLRRVDLLDRLWHKDPIYTGDDKISFGVYSEDAVLECDYGILEDPPPGYTKMGGATSERDPELDKIAFRCHKDGFSVRGDILKHCLGIALKHKPVFSVEGSRFYMRYDPKLLIERIPKNISLAPNGFTNTGYKPENAYYGEIPEKLDITDVVNPRLGFTIAQQAIFECIDLRRNNLWFTPDPDCHVEVWKSFAEVCKRREMASICMSRYQPAHYEKEVIDQVRNILRWEVATAQHADMKIPRVVLLPQNFV